MVSICIRLLAVILLFTMIGCSNNQIPTPNISDIVKKQSPDILTATPQSTYTPNPTATPNILATVEVEVEKQILNIPTTTPQPTPTLMPTITPAPTTTPQLSVSDVREQVRNNVVRVKSINGNIGTGIIINSNGGIITNAHVIDDNKNFPVIVYFRRSSGAYISTYGTVTDVSTNSDLAYILTHYTPKHYFELDYNPDIPRIGTEVIALGYPHTSVSILEPTVTNGVVSNIEMLARPGLNYPLRMIQTNVIVNHGNSGGPLVDYNGNLVGLMTRAHSKLHNDTNIWLGEAINAKILEAYIRVPSQQHHKSINHLHHKWITYTDYNYRYNVDVHYSWEIEDSDVDYVKFKKQDEIEASITSSTAFSGTPAVVINDNLGKQRSNSNSLDVISESGDVEASFGTKAMIVYQRQTDNCIKEFIEYVWDINLNRYTIHINYCVGKIDVEKIVNHFINSFSVDAIRMGRIKKSGNAQ